MNHALFLERFQQRFSPAIASQPSPALEDPELRRLFDPCPEVQGMSSPKKLRLLNLAYGLLPPGEAWLEIGTFHGKSLIATLAGQPARPCYACDDFSQFGDHGNTLATLRANLAAHALADRVNFFHGDFRRCLTEQHVYHPVGGYFFDGPHDYASQYDALRLVEPLLADEALVIVDDWRRADDSGSEAKAASEDWMAKSGRRWRTLMELPARYNGDQAMWWNGLGVLWCSKS